MSSSNQLTNTWLRIIQKVQASEEGTTVSNVAKDLRVDIGHIDWRINRLVESEILTTDGVRIWPNSDHFFFPTDEEEPSPRFSINWIELVVGWVLGQISLYPFLLILGLA